jgi:hypothetical protein
VQLWLVVGAISESGLDRLDGAPVDVMGFPHAGNLRLQLCLPDDEIFAILAECREPDAAWRLVIIVTRGHNLLRIAGQGTGR